MEKRAKRTRSKPAGQVKIAKERIEILFNEARQIILEDKQDGKQLANRYVQLARRIGMRYNVRLPRKFRRIICRKCKKYLYPGITSQQRVKKGFIKIKCLQCNKISNYRIKTTDR